ncbi:HAMP domain-containing sensor histidine kinase [Psychrobacter sp. TB55-MNA-CIBAN-0194]|uniref:HAMP domain-containing sensor histidine kinase n=1 Tax=Psychrobacter sp. TB55-MNA-CIBAN-0194 TaxID=3140445 RepID=UPI00331851E6
MSIEKIPFKVSARTARLIGRENVASAKGAVIELVKNAYDADSDLCIVYFDFTYTRLKEEADENYLCELYKSGISRCILNKYYKKHSVKNDIYKFQSESDEDILDFKSHLSKCVVLYIIDFGEGMTKDIIINNWMTIGTDNKANDIFTQSGRVKSGAKGIGRFALDRLGSKCKMTTVFNPDVHQKFKSIDMANGYEWEVNWEDFDGQNKTIDSVNATLMQRNSLDYLDEVKKIIPEEEWSIIRDRIYETKNSSISTDFGTILKISGLRDDWSEYYINQLYKDLEVLVPPKETAEFILFLYSSSHKTDYGEIQGIVCDDYDFKLVAKASRDKNVEIKVYRNEYDVQSLPDSLFEMPTFQEEPYLKEDFERGFWQVTRTFGELLPGYTVVDQDNVFDDIGEFEFTLFFMKKTYSSPDAKRFFYRAINSSQRKYWLDSFSGIKIFRDDFRVRPYGEVNQSSFDWLGLGSRKAASPAGVAKKGAGYRINPENISGAIKISRLTNIAFEDKSSREGLQDNKTFEVFKKIINSIIHVFEIDRSYIAQHMDQYDRSFHQGSRDKEKANKLAEEIIKRSREKSGSQASSSNVSSDPEKEVLAYAVESKNEEIEKLKEEQKMLRALASSGIVMASFSHDLSKLKDILKHRISRLERVLSESLEENDFSNVPVFRNPFHLARNMKKDDMKLANWLSFSLGSTRKDKRNRKNIKLVPYFKNYKQDWTGVLDSRNINLIIDDVNDCSIRAFEIDLDSIFNNLLVNSIDSFNILKENRDREVCVKVSETDSQLIIEYKDSGCGLNPEITNANEIFEPLFTTKRSSSTGDEVGTGLGMWIIKSVIEENDGDIQLLYPNIGFAVKITFPTKFKRKEND